MNFPWVSRKRLEDAERRLEECDNERRDLLKRLLDREPLPPGKPVSVEEDSSKGVVPYTTPFDRIERSFAMAGSGARRPEFKARVR